MSEKELVYENFKHLEEGQHRVYCPSCHSKRKKHNQHQKELAVNIDSENIKYYCHHCGINGGVSKRQNTIKSTITSEKANEMIREIKLDTYKHTEKTKHFLSERKIDEDVIDKYSVGNVYSFQGRKRNGIGFPYLDEQNNVTAIKWRSADTDKLFSMEGNCNTFYNINNIIDEKSLIICEGEIDALTWMSVLKEKQGIGVVSVPNGASNKISEDVKTPQEDTKYKYVWSAREKLNTIDEIIFSGDADEQGKNLLEELARRIGRAKCWLVDLSPYKDANECLQKEGKEFLIDRLNKRKPYPVSGLYRAVDIRSKVDELYTEGKPTGYDLHSAVPLQIAMKQMTVVTGLPSSGKSNFVDDCCVYLAQTYGIKICYASFEKPMAEHLTQLATHISGKVFFDTDGAERITEEELDASMDFINDHFVFQDFSGGRSTKIEDVLDIASASVMWGAKILVIDPYNWIETDDGGNISEVVSNILTKVQNWAVANDSHVFFVAHPSKLQDRRVPEGMEIANSMSWFAKTDNGITIHRDEDRNPLCKIWKVRWSWLGSPQTIYLSHNPITGCFAPRHTQSVDWSFADDFMES
jgi:twinkle protein